MEVLIALVVWFAGLQQGYVSDDLRAVQEAYGLTWDGGCYVHEDGSGSCEGYVFPGYDDLTEGYYAR